MPPLDSAGAEDEISRIFKQRADRLLSGLESLTREFLEPLPPPVPGDAPAGTQTGERSGRPDSSFLAESVRTLASSEDQISLLDRLLEGASRFFSRVCLFIVRDDTAHGWSSVGLPETELGDPAKGLSVPLAEEPVLRAAVEGREPVHREMADTDLRFLPPLRPGDRVPSKSLTAPLIVMDKVSAILYADDGGDGRITHDPGGAEVLVSVASLVANRLALLSRPAAVDVEARADLQVQVPAEEEGGGLVSGPLLLESDPLEEEFSETPPPPSGGDGEQIPAGDRALHEDARRFARLLVSEILLYNEDSVVLGRKQRDLYARLKEEIDRSRLAYNQRVPPGVSARSDYFREELVRTLAAGDSTALGPGMAP